MDLTTACYSFPVLEENLILRDNLLDTIETMFSKNDVVVIEGEEGIGKTTLLAQFSKKFPDNAISLFINTSSRYGYDPSYLRLDLFNQIYWRLYKKEVKHDEELDESAISAHLYDLQRYAQRRKTTFYFVIDGLDDIPDSDRYVIDIIFDMIPVGMRGFKFLFSANDIRNLEDIFLQRKIKYAPYPLTSFTLDQTIKFFTGFELEELYIEDIHKTCRGIPGYLASVRRIIETGIDSRSILSALPEELPGLFKLEWDQVDTTDNNLVNILGMVAFSRVNLTLDEMCKILDIDAKTVKDSLEKLSFISYSEDRVSFVSESFRKYAAQRLEHIQERTNDLIIEYLLRNPDSDKTLKYLPEYLEQTKRFEDLITYLSPDNLYKLLVQCDSLSTLRQIGQIGINASKQLNKDQHLIRFSLQNAVINESINSNVWLSEIKARMALNDYESAMALAQSTKLLEDKLQMLATIAKLKKEAGFTPEAVLIEQIESLCEKVDFKAIGDKTISIASDLMYVKPQLAIDIIGKYTDSDDGENAIDFALATLSLTALGSRKDNAYNEVIENIRSMIKDPIAKLISTEVSIKLREYTAKEIISEVEKLTSTSDKLYLIAHWASNNKKLDGAEHVLEYALKLAVSTTDYAPNARVYKDLSMQLPFIEDAESLKRLMGFFDGQKVNLEKYGPTEDYIALQLNLARTEAKIDMKSACNRIIDLYFYITQITDITIQTTCLSQLLSELDTIDPSKELEAREGIHSMVLEEFQKNLDIILKGAASHLDETRNIIKYLGKNKFDLALEIINKLNTEHRRDQAYLELTKAILDEQSSTEDLKKIKIVLERICDPDVRDDVVVYTMEWLTYKNKNQAITIEDLRNAMFILDRVYSISESEEKCKCCCLSYLLLRNFDQYTSFANGLLKELELTWDSIDVGWRKVDIGFKIVNLLAPYDLEKAKEYLQKTEDYRHTIDLCDSKNSWGFKYSLLLISRALSGLIKQDMVHNDDLSRLTSLIDCLPSYGEKALIWNDIALRYYSAKKLDMFKDIVLNKIKYLYNRIPDIDRSYKDHVLKIIAPSLYLAHKTTAFECIDRLSDSDKDQAYQEIALFILTKKPPYDPYDFASEGFDGVTYEEIIDLIELIGKVSADYLVYNLVKSVVEAVIGTKPNRSSFSREQKADIVARIEKMIEDKLPNTRYIKHNGYKLISLAELFRIKNPQYKDWKQLIDAAKDIPNTSDSAFVLSIIANHMSKKQRDHTMRLIDEIEATLERIPTIIDKIDGYGMLADSIMRLDKQRSKEYLKRAMEIAISEKEDEEIYSAQRRIIDLAYRIEPQFAASLVSLTDNDPAKHKSKQNLDRYIKLLETKRSMLKETEINFEDLSYYSAASWKLLGSLNAGRASTLHMQEVRKYTDVISMLPLSKAYPIISWIIENAIVRFTGTDQAVSYLRPIFESTILGAELSLRLTSKNNAKIMRIKQGTIDTHQDSLVVKAGEREKALNFIKNWLSKELNGYLKICDPYFGPSDLDILQTIRSIDPNCEVFILTSKKNQGQGDLQQLYMDYWKFNISDQDPPETTIVIAGTRSQGVLPIHDRWWITGGNKGLRIGTSYNSLGLGRESEISVLSEREAEEREIEVDKFLSRKEREYNGERLIYTTFDLYI